MPINITTSIPGINRGLLEEKETDASASTTSQRIATGLKLLSQKMSVLDPRESVRLSSAADAVRMSEQLLKMDSVKANDRMMSILLSMPKGLVQSLHLGENACAADIYFSLMTAVANNHQYPPQEDEEYSQHVAGVENVNPQHQPHQSSRLQSRLQPLPLPLLQSQSQSQQLPRQLQPQSHQQQQARRHRNIAAAEYLAFIKQQPEIMGCIEAHIAMDQALRLVSAKDFFYRHIHCKCTGCSYETTMMKK